MTDKDQHPKVIYDSKGKPIAFKRRFSNTYWIPPKDQENPTITHEDCPVKLRLCESGPHFARFDCAVHNKFIKWATQEEVDLYNMIMEEKRAEEWRLLNPPAGPKYTLPQSLISNISGGFGTGSISNT